MLACGEGREGNGVEGRLLTPGLAWLRNASLRRPLLFGVTGRDAGARLDGRLEFGVATVGAVRDCGSRTSLRGAGVGVELFRATSVSPRAAGVDGRAKERKPEPFGRIRSASVALRWPAGFGRDPRTAGAVVASFCRDAGSEFRATDVLPPVVAEGRITFPRPRPDRFGIATSPAPRTAADGVTPTSLLRRIPLRVGTLT